MSEPASVDDQDTEMWRSILTGTDPHLRQMRRLWRRIPSAPRCKVCASPFHGIGRAVSLVTSHGPSDANPLLCTPCFGSLRKFPGGAEIELSILFADVRGSSGIAERTSAAEFRRLLQRFYAISARAIDRNGGIVDKFLGDGVMALFIPVITGENHPGRAIAAGRELLAMADEPELIAGGMRVGVGLHTGLAFVGALGSGDKIDFSALGDAVNIAARLGSAAGPGEMLASTASWKAASLPLEGLDRREIEIAGRTAPLEIVSVHPASAAKA